MNNPTIKDVAKLAGVAVSTVSRTFNGGPVHQSTRLAVERAARTLGYRSDPAAQSLASGRHNSVGVVVRDFTDYYTNDIIAAIVATLQGAGYRASLSDSGAGRAMDAETIAHCARANDGLILLSPSLSDNDLAALCAPERTVLANRIRSGYPSVAADETTGMEQTIRHLVSLGHRRIVYIAGPQYSWTETRRRAAFLDACERMSIRGTTLGPFTPTYSSGHAAADALLTEPDVTAAIAFNDLLASGIVARLFDRGFSVPSDYSVVGIDNSVVARATRPQLTSVDNRQRDVGATAASMLVDMLRETGATPARGAGKGKGDAGRTGVGRAGASGADGRVGAGRTGTDTGKTGAGRVDTNGANDANVAPVPETRQRVLSGTLIIRGSTGPARAE